MLAHLKTSEMEVALRFKLLTQLTQLTLLTQWHIWHIAIWLKGSERLIIGFGSFILKLGLDGTDHHTHLEEIPQKTAIVGQKTLILALFYCYPLSSF